MNNLYFTPLSLSQLLKEKGVEVESEHYWAKWPTVNGYGYVISDTLEVEGEGEVEGYACYNLSELPDVFRQVFGIKESESVTVTNKKGHSRIKLYMSEAMKEFERFSAEYFKDPKSAWSKLEEAICQIK